MITQPPIHSPEFQSHTWQEWFRTIREFLTRTIVTTLDFPNIGANSSADLTVNFPGASLGSVVIATPETIELNLTWSTFVSSQDVITVRVHNTSGGGVDPASRKWRITVLRY